MAGILDPLASGLSDVLTPILGPTDDPTPPGVSVSIVTVPVTVSVTVSEPPTSTSHSSTTSSSSTTHTASNSTTSAFSTTSTSTNTTDPEFITTTFLTQNGSAMVTVTAVVENPAHLHNNQDPSGGGFFNNHTAVIGVFTVVGIVCFVIIAGAIMWIARRRALKTRQRELAEKNSRDFFQDEVNDQDEHGTQSEKSWWGNASGASIPEGGGMPLQVVTSGYGTMPPMPPLPSEYSHSGALKTPVSESDAGMTISHPYASASPSVTSDAYFTLERNTSFSTRVTSPTQSLPPTIPVVPYRNPSTSTNGKLSHIDEIRPLSPPVPNHPFASPPSNRKSELFPEEVLWNLGTQGGMGRSLSGRREAEPPVPIRPSDSRPLSPQQQQPPPRAIQQLTEALEQPQTLLYVADPTRDKSSPNDTVRTTTTTATSHSGNLSNVHPPAPAPRPVSALISEGGWYDDSNSEVGKAVALAGATASGESFLNTRNGRNDRFGYPYHHHDERTNRSQASSFKETMKSAATSAHDVSERQPTVGGMERKVPHDPRFSGLFGNVMTSGGRASEDFEEEEEEAHGKSGNRVLRVTNE